jgi:hypothetical protein
VHGLLRLLLLHQEERGRGHGDGLGALLFLPFLYFEFS